MYRVVIYSPDRHILYEPEIAERDGVGGGLTARLRLAQALAKQGCNVTLVANFRRHLKRKCITYIPINEAGELMSDVLVLNSTGGGFDLSPAIHLNAQARLRMVWVNNLTRVRGLESLPWDYIVTPSNHVRHVVSELWGIRRDKLVVIYNGVPELPRFAFLRALRRDPFRLIYTSHPSKGLDAALKLLALLRQEEPRFELHIFGGRRLWGENEERFDPPAGVTWHGLVGQKRLREELMAARFAIHLQAAEEAFGIALAEAMAAGCIVLASHVGAYPELIRDGHNGFLIDGSYDAPETLARAARKILTLVRTPELVAKVQRNAAATSLRWSTIARTWIELWDRILGSAREFRDKIGNCEECHGSCYVLADGYHCITCGHFSCGSFPYRA
jgi:glycosyltransferase involved in cell wall biosynthesis